ncbi:telomerase inhibitor/ribosome biogenesis protein PXR1 [Aspergillus mulundensis]|uniref:Protein PXR1 n=1 Tax=Aspergillus mulundensis TaxID=1810919 RepID=A0A3D8T5E4_9EURO|nr:Uncharacterized protein DSM5745_00550 [Aspergillus mulundensis]RDW93228.1 Uncharacterized protein DSM5745_00550 [Aspergillus mulundensis]
MGLAAPRKRTKISHDPNNTNWSRSTSGFGHKILSSQGWTPGSFLGARNAAHADMFTAASASHIRVFVKDDTLGLGARSKREPLDEPTGLDAFKGLLGRLNGKSDAELQVEQRKRDDVKLARYAATKWQAVRFISGGLLAQEKEVTTFEKARNPLADAKETPCRIPEVKMKAANATDNDYGEEVSDDKTESIDASEDSGSHNRREKDKTDKDSKKKKDRKDKKGKKDKKDSKDRKDNKEKKRKRAEQQEDSDNPLQTRTMENGTHSSNEQDQLPSDTVKERRPPGRHMIRGRYIAQKRKAVMDEKSLNEIFMVKS